MSEKIKSLAPLGATDEGVIVPLRGTIWCGGAVPPGFVPLRGTHLGFYSLAALRATRAFGAGNEGVIADMPRHVPTQDSAIITQNCRDVTCHVRNRSTPQNDAGIEGVSPEGRPLSNPQWNSCSTGGYRAIVSTSPAATPLCRAKVVRKVVAAGDELLSRYHPQ